MLPYRFMPKTGSRTRKLNDDFPQPKHAKIVSRKIGYRGKVYTVVADQVREPDGVSALREIIRHHGSVVVLPLDDSVSPARVLLVRQYRYAADDYLWELPAGHIDRGEAGAAAAKRELLEETGLSAKKWKRALKFFVSPGIHKKLQCPLPLLRRQSEIGAAAAKRELLEETGLSAKKWKRALKFFVSPGIHKKLQCPLPLLRRQS